MAIPPLTDAQRLERETNPDEQIARRTATDAAAQDAHGVRYLRYWMSRTARPVPR